MTTHEVPPKPDPILDDVGLFGGIGHKRWTLLLRRAWARKNNRTVEEQAAYDELHRLAGGGANFARLAFFSQLKHPFMEGGKLDSTAFAQWLEQAYGDE